MKNSIQRKAILFVTALILILSVLIGGTQMIIMYRGQSNEVALEMNSIALRKAAELNKNMVEAETAVKSIYALANELIPSAKAMEDEEQRAVVTNAVRDVFVGIAKDSDAVISNYMTYDPELIHARDGLFYSKDAYGVLQENEITDITAYDPEDVEHIGWYTIPKRARKPVWMEPYYNRNIDRWLISYVIPMFKDDKMIAVIGMDFDFEQIVTDLDTFRFYREGYAFLKNADGTIHYHPAYFNGESHGDHLEGIPEKDATLIRSGETENRAVTYTYQGRKRVGVVTTLENGMQLFLSDSYTDVYWDRSIAVFSILGFTLLLMFLGIIATLLMIRRVTKPVQKLTEAISEIERGNYQVEIPKTDQDEIGILAGGVDLLARSLQRQKELNESTLAERNRQLQIAVEEAQGANKAKTAFISNMSHDIRTPMNAVLGLSSLAQNHLGEPEKLRFYLDQIGVAGKQLLSIINNILEISRIESNKLEIDESVVDTNEIYEGLMTIFEHQARSQNLTFRFQNHVEHRYLYLDRTHVEEILTNLISNAMKYTQDGGTIDVNFEELPGADEEHVVIRSSVRDNGIGMSEEYQKKMFDSFERERNSTVNGIQGTGLGLSIVKRLVDLMHGTIQVNSHQNIGTIMTVELPHRIAEAPEQTVNVAAETEKVSFEGKRVLLVEDIDINAMIAEEVLAGRGLLVERAKDGEEAVRMLERASEDYYELILMDIQMPVMDGYTATKVIRKLPDHKKATIPIIAMTANAFQEDRIRVLEAGMNAHIGKPIDVDHLFATLGRIMAYKLYIVDSAELTAFKEECRQKGKLCGYYIYRADSKGTLVFADEATWSIYGCSTNKEFMDLVNGSFEGMVHQEDRARVENEIEKQQTLNPNGIDNITFRMIRKDGAVRTLQDRGYKAFDGTDMLYYVYVADITEE